MVRASILLLLAINYSPIIAQSFTAQQLLEKAINYHDPNDNWKTFSDEFTVVMTTPNASNRTSVISIDLPLRYFNVSATRDATTTSYKLDKKQCYMSYNGIQLDSTEAKSKNMSCERAKMYKNYYTYLYGLPMKLKDPGTNLNTKVERKKFKGKDYLVLKATYDKAVGSDVWFFYFDPKTYAMKIYQFFKTDDKGEVLPDSGEYILLSDIKEVSEIKMPKVRAWYYNKDDAYLGTDTLIN